LSNRNQLLYCRLIGRRAASPTVAPADLESEDISHFPTAHGSPLSAVPVSLRVLNRKTGNPEAGRSDRVYENHNQLPVQTSAPVNRCSLAARSTEMPPSNKRSPASVDNAVPVAGGCAAIRSAHSAAFGLAGFASMTVSLKTPAARQIRKSGSRDA